MPPRWVFGFTFCRWGWTNRTYIDNTLHRWRSGKYPSDAFIMDFGWFTHVSDYSFPPKGFSDYHDFGYNNVTLPDPVAQLKSYRNDLHYRFGGIRKPRLGNTELLNEARSLGLMLPGGEGGGSLNAHAYAFKRNLNFSHPPTREWYNAKMAHYLDDGEQASKQAAHGKQHSPLTTPSLPSLKGVDFWWNDEGETDYYTFYYWSLAQSDLLRSSSKPTQRFFSLSRLLARIGAFRKECMDGRHPSNVGRATQHARPHAQLGVGRHAVCSVRHWRLHRAEQRVAIDAMVPARRLPAHYENALDQAGDAALAVVMGRAIRDRDAQGARAALQATRLPLFMRARDDAGGGALWMRPLVAEFPDDPAASELTYEWLDGPSILAAPVVYESGNYSTYLPKGLWMEYNTTASHQGPVTLQGDSSPLLSVPMFMRVPSIVPITPLVQHTGELPGGPLEVHVYSSSGAEDEDDGTTTFTVYEDDGETTDYLTRPSTTSREIAFAWAADKLTLTWVVTGSEAVPSGGFTEVSVVLLRPGKPRSVSSPWKIGRGGKVVF